MNTSYKILIVDDEELNVELMLDVLEDEGYQTASASNGSEAIDKFKEFRPNLILLDVMMPVMDGYQACQTIRDLEDDIGKDIPILFISAKASLEDKVHGYEVGGNDYITKPFDNAELLLKINLTFKEIEQVNTLQDSIKDSNQMAYSLMTTASKVGAVGQFLRKVLFCNTVDELLQHFFEVSLSANLGCTIKITFNNETLIVSDDGIERAIDFEIIQHHTNDQRIFYFGKNRALFNWGHVVMLIRNVGDEADNIATMLDGLSAGIQFIQAQSSLLNSLQSFQNENVLLKEKAEKATERLEDDIHLTLKEILSGSGLTQDEENSIASIIEKNRVMLDEILLSGWQLEKDLEETLMAYKNRK